MRRIFIIIIAFATVTITNAQLKGKKANLALLDSCAHGIAVGACAHLSPGHTDIYIDSTRDAFLISGQLLRAAHALESGKNAATGDICRAHVLDAGIQYKKIGDQILLRTAQMRVAIDIRDSTGKTRWSDALSAQLSDTVQCDDVANLESPNVEASRAPNPCTEEAGAFSSIIEPVILAAASATIVLLLFTVRSQ
ncbi:MAG TPA: hypothetical protein VFA55_09375 [Candidatus Kapabacteria bacterium]|nr:hypothetical protein [Candidatus Kapabacteria bacterium]